MCMSLTQSLCDGVAWRAIHRAHCSQLVAKTLLYRFVMIKFLSREVWTTVRIYSKSSLCSIPTMVNGKICVRFARNLKRRKSKILLLLRALKVQQQPTPKKSPLRTPWLTTLLEVWTRFYPKKLSSRVQTRRLPANSWWHPLPQIHFYLSRKI